MKIGIAIPCYNEHIKHLYKLLESIDKQTRIPDQVVVSCSSSFQDDFTEKKKYSFPLEIIITDEKKNTAQNRNICISHLEKMDYISFFDADDIMSLQRIEFLEKVIEMENPDIILHNYFNNNEIEKDDFFLEKEVLSFSINSLKQCFSGCIIHKDFNSNNKIHHGQVTVKKNHLDEIQFPEELDFISKEDCVFCYRIFNLPFIKNAYISNKLSFYKSSNSYLLFKN